MKRLTMALALTALIACANGAHAQQLSWSSGFPTKGSQAKAVAVKGMVDAKLNATEVLVWAYKQGGQKSGVGESLTVDLNGNWGAPTGTNVFPPTGNSGDTLQIVVQCTVGGKTYALNGSAVCK